MSLHIGRGTVLKICTVVLFIGLVILSIIYSEFIFGILYPFIISMFIAYLLNPLICIMEQKRIKRTFGIIIIYLIFVGILIFISFYLMPILIRDIGKLITELPKYSSMIKNYMDSIQDKYSRIGLPEGIKNAISNIISRVENYISSYLESVISSIISSLSKIFNLALIPILVFYFLKDYKSIWLKAERWVPRKYRNGVKRTCVNIDEVFGNYIRSQIMLSIIIAVLTTLALLILNVDYAVILGIVNGITNIIPYFGPLLGAIPAIAFAFMQSPLKALYTFIAMTVIQQIESDIISPKITGDSVGLHPITVILALLIGGELFGITGLVLGVPAAAALKIIYRDIMKNLF